MIVRQRCNESGDAQTVVTQTVTRRRVIPCHFTWETMAWLTAVVPSVAGNGRRGGLTLGRATAGLLSGRSHVRTLPARRARQGRTDRARVSPSRGLA